MFTRNMVGRMTFTSGATQKVYKITEGSMVSRNNNSSTSISSISSGLYYEETGTTSSSGWTNTGIVLGTGTTSPTVDDYKMESYIAEGILTYGASTIVTPSLNVEWANNGTFSITQTVSNNTANPVTVTELGVYQSSSAVSAACMLLTHDVISPVTIQPNETKTFVIAWDLSDILNGGSTNVTAS